MTEAAKEDRKKYIIKRTVIGLSIVAFIILWIYLSKRYFYLYKTMYLYTKKYVENMTVMRYLFLSFLNVAFQLLFVPGYSIFLAYLGNITNSFVRSMLIYYPSCCVIKVVVYFITKSLLREPVRNMLSDKWYFKIYYDKSREAPWTVSILLRLMFIPITHKNYLIPLFDIPFLPYIVPAVIHNFFYAGIFIVLGMHGYYLRNIFSGEIPHENTAKQEFYYKGVTAMQVVSLAVLVVIIAYTISMYFNFKKAEKKKALAESAAQKPSGNELLTTYSTA